MTSQPVRKRSTVVSLWKMIGLSLCMVVVCAQDPDSMTLKAQEPTAKPLRDAQDSESKNGTPELAQPRPAYGSLGVLFDNIVNALEVAGFETATKIVLSADLNNRELQKELQLCLPFLKDAENEGLLQDMVRDCTMIKEGIECHKRRLQSLGDSTARLVLVTMTCKRGRTTRQQSHSPTTRRSRHITYVMLSRDAPESIIDTGSDRAGDKPATAWSFADPAILFMRVDDLLADAPNSGRDSGPHGPGDKAYSQVSISLALGFLVTDIPERKCQLQTATIEFERLEQRWVRRSDCATREGRDDARQDNDNVP